MNDKREMKLEWTPEMVEAVRNMKPFDYEKHDDEIKKYIKGSERSGTT